MKFVYYQLKGAKRVGVLTHDETGIFPIGAVDPELESKTMISVIREITPEVMDKLKFGLKLIEDKSPAVSADVIVPVGEVKILAPIQRPIHDVMCCGVNYQDHRDEGKDVADENYDDQEYGVYFGKRAVKIIGPDEAIISNPELDPKLDYEVELAVIIGKEGKDIQPEDAAEYIFGYSVFNDVSSRELQSRHDQWYRGKSLDTYTAMGPCILTVDELPFPPEVDVISTLNGEERQHSNTRMFINPLANIIAELSQATTLEPGDIIATGTPAGVGMSKGYMMAGDTIVCEIPEIGKLVNPIK